MTSKKFLALLDNPRGRGQVKSGQVNDDDFLLGSGGVAEACATHKQPDYCPTSCLSKNKQRVRVVQ